MVTTKSGRLGTGFYEQLTDTECPASSLARFPINVRFGFREILVEGGATDDIFLHFVPAIRQMWFYDASLALANRWTDLGASEPRLFDRHRTAGALKVAAGALMTTEDFWYIGTVGKVGGYRIDVSIANDVDTGEVPTAENSTGAGWTAAGTFTDTTDSGTDGQFLFVDGLLTMVAATNWTSSRLRDSLGKDNPGGVAASEPLYWTRIAIPAGTADMAAKTSIIGITPMAETLANGLTTDGDAFRVKPDVEYTVPIRMPKSIGALEFVSSTTTGRTPAINWLRR